MPRWLKKLLGRGTPPPPSNLYRLELTISRELAEELEKFRREGNIENLAWLFGNFVCLYRWAKKRSEEGKTIVALDIEKNTYHEMHLAALENSKANALAEKFLKENGFTQETDPNDER